MKNPVIAISVEKEADFFSLNPKNMETIKFVNRHDCGDFCYETPLKNVYKYIEHIFDQTKRSNEQMLSKELLETVEAIDAPPNQYARNRFGFIRWNLKNWRSC